MTQLEVIRAFIRGEPARMNNIKSTGTALMIGQTVVSTRHLDTHTLSAVFSCSCGGNPCGMVWNTINRLLRQCHKLEQGDLVPFAPIKFTADPENQTKVFTARVNAWNFHKESE
jgi:hypothetical protein